MFTVEQREKAKQVVQDHPFAIKSIAGLITAMGVIVGATLTVDSRYAKAADLGAVQKEQREQTSVLKNMQTQNTLLYLDIIERDRRALEREAIILQRKQNKSPEDLETLEYIKERLKELNDRRDKLQRSIGIN